jgi:hypothetical protein
MTHVFSQKTRFESRPRDKTSRGKSPRFLLPRPLRQMLAEACPVVDISVGYSSLLQVQSRGISAKRDEFPSL